MTIHEALEQGREITAPAWMTEGPYRAGWDGYDGSGINPPVMGPGDPTKRTPEIDDAIREQAIDDAIRATGAGNAPVIERDAGRDGATHSAGAPIALLVIGAVLIWAAFD